MRMLMRMLQLSGCKNIDDILANNELPHVLTQPV